jgi:hypothetical protein
LAHAFTVENRGDHLWIAQEGALEDLAQAERMQREIEAHAERTACQLVLFDNRNTDVVSNEIRRSMFDWVTTQFDRAALLLQSDLAVVRANMDSLARGAKLRAFDNALEAVDWLRASRALRRQKLPAG